MVSRRYGLVLIVMVALVALVTLWFGYARAPGKRVPDKAQLVYGEGGVRWQRW